MKGVVFEKVGAEPKIVDNLKKPSPNPDQILVKSLWTAINPVDDFMAGYGLLVVDWPLVLGVDASGVIVEAGEVAKSKYGFQPGDHVCGCTRLGSAGYSAGQEYFLMDAHVTIPKPKNLSIIQAATIGVGMETACLGLYEGLKLELPKVGAIPKSKGEWVVILGGASSVGRSAVQLALASGYKVVTSCSPKSAKAVQELGPTIFDYKQPIEHQVEEVMKITGGDIYHIFDATAADDPVVPKALFKAANAGKPRLFATTNDWSGIGDFEGGSSYLVRLGGIGRPDAPQLNADIEKFIPVIVDLVESGKVVPAEYEVIGNGGFDDMITAYHHQKKGAGGSKKVVVKVGDP